MIGKIVALCFVALMVFIGGVIIGMAIEERIQDDIRERESRRARGLRYCPHCGRMMEEV